MFSSGKWEFKKGMSRGIIYIYIYCTFPFFLFNHCQVLFFFEFLVLFRILISIPIGSLALWGSESVIDHTDDDA
jgi:hypothetical protein